MCQHIFDYLMRLTKKYRYFLKEMGKDGYFINTTSVEF